MVTIFNKCTQIQKELKSIQVRNNILRDFRIVLRTNENLYVYVIIVEENAEIIESIKDLIISINEKTEIEFLFEIDLVDAFYKNIFSYSDYIIINRGRRRFNSILDNDNITSIKCPIATFYSYKGGMGRSTTLAAFAMHLALIEKLNVIIIDCDFEAPGFTNFYLTNSREENQRQGFIEYFLDKESGFITKENLEKYTWEVENKYCGEGSIRIMPAGNLDSNISTSDFLNTHLNHYIEGLSRIDITNNNYIIEGFSGLIEDIENAFHPDIILIDSRTGFNDIMGITAFQLSKFVIGFFRNDAQSLPGLNFFLQNMVSREYIEPYLINSILPASISLKKTLFNSFKDDIKKILENLKEDSGLDFPCFPISRNENLEIIGMSAEETNDFIELIKNKEIKEFKEFFEHFSTRIISLIKESKKNNEDIILIEPSIDSMDFENNEIIVNIDSPLIKAPSLDEVKRASLTTRQLWRMEFKKTILESTYEKIVKTSLYAEGLKIEEEFDNNQFFFRVCMNDLFNIDKSIILGSKGTGKSYIYKALGSIKIVLNLKERANKVDNFHFIYTIDKNDRIFRVNRWAEKDKQFQYRFWLIYTWQILSKEILKNFSDFKLNNNIEIIEIRDDETTRLNLERLIKNDNYILRIEDEFKVLDEFLIHNQGEKKDYITILYDQLDEIVDPFIWNNWIPTLIDFWRYKRYNRIYGKLFIRKDLFRKLVGLSNVNDIENQSIDIEWSQEEMFSYFFKLVFSNGIESTFWAIMYLYEDYDPIIIAQNRKQYNKLQQISLEESLLRPLATTFFGKNVDVNETTRMGESYDWFYRNLKNADDTISLRPFIDLIKFAIESYKNEKYKSQELDKPILFQKYYTDKIVRLNAVEKHFEDLVRNEKGNQPIRFIFDYISNANIKFKRITLFKNNFEELLSNVIRQYKDEREMKGQTKNSLEELLITNGIVKKENYGRGDEYKFAFLYKYKLGLKGI